MEVKIEADELCELRKKAEYNRTWDYHKICYDGLKKKFDALEKERDFWRDRAFFYARTSDSSQYAKLVPWDKFLAREAREKGYEVPE